MRQSLFSYKPPHPHVKYFFFQNRSTILKYQRMRLVLKLISGASIMGTVWDKYVRVDKYDASRDYRMCWKPCFFFSFCKPLCPYVPTTTSTSTTTTPTTTRTTKPPILPYRTRHKIDWNRWDGISEENMITIKYTWGTTCILIVMIVICVECKFKRR